MPRADIQRVENTSTDKESIQMEVKARAVAEILTKHYPNHPWAVGWAPGMTLVVKHLAGDSRYGYTIDGTKALTAKQLSHMAMVAGGELLERMGMERKAWDGEQFGNKYEGADR